MATPHDTHGVVDADWIEWAEANPRRDAMTPALFGCMLLVAAPVDFRLEAKVGREQALKMVARLGAQVRYWDEGADLPLPGEPSSVDLTGKFVTDADLESLKYLPTLHDVSLSHTPVTNSSLRHLKHLPRLWTLDLSYTSVTDDGLCHLKGLECLRHLTLDGTCVTHLPNLGQLARLSTLSMCNTDIGDDDVARLNGFHRLFILNVRGTRITDKTLKHFIAMRNLHSVLVGGTAITDEAAKEAEKTRPTLTVSK
jgi:hypothetical protein